jgi:hypothetical protein
MAANLFFFCAAPLLQAFPRNIRHCVANFLPQAIARPQSLELRRPSYIQGQTGSPVLLQ